MINKTNQFIHILSGVVLFLAFILMIYFGYLLFYPFKTCVFYKDSFTTIKKQYIQGEPLTYKCHYHKYTSMQATMIPMLVDSVIYQLPEMKSNNPMGEQELQKSSFNIPNYLPPGKYKLKLTIIYKINPIREIKHNVETNEFEVIAKEDLSKDVNDLKTYSYGYQDYKAGKIK
jgi:hypothetical protein